MPPSEKAVKEAIEIVKKELESPEMEAAIFGPSPSDRCINCGGYYDPDAMGMEDWAGCNCEGDYRPQGWEPKGTDSYMWDQDDDPEILRMATSDPAWKEGSDE
jgi:hypothetical protein